MPIERETIVERPASETAVVDDGTPLAIIGGIIAAIVVVLMIVWLANGGVSTGGNAVNVDLPSVTVTD